MLFPGNHCLCRVAGWLLDGRLSSLWGCWTPLCLVLTTFHLSSKGLQDLQWQILEGNVGFHCKSWINIHVYHWFSSRFLCLWQPQDFFCTLLVLDCNKSSGWFSFLNASQDGRLRLWKHCFIQGSLPGGVTLYWCRLKESPSVLRQGCRFMGFPKTLSLALC